MAGSGAITVTPGYLIVDGEKATNAKFRLIASPVAVVNPNSIGSDQLIASDVTALVTHPTGSTTVLANSGTTPGIYKSADFAQGIFDDGLITIGSTTFSSATANFTADDVGKVVIASGLAQATVISSFVSATSVVLSNPGLVQYSDGLITGTTTLLSASATFTIADNGRTVVGNNIPVGTTITFVDSATVTLSQVATNGVTTFQIDGRTQSNTQFTIVGRGKGWQLEVDGNGVGRAEIYVGGLGAQIAVGSFAINADGSLILGTGATQFTANANGDFLWGSGSSVIGILNTGHLYAGSATYGSAVFTVDPAGNLFVNDVASTTHNIGIGALNPTTLQGVVCSPAGGAIVNPTGVTISCATQYSDIFYRLVPTDGVSNGTATYTSAAGNFTVKDIGKTIIGTDIPADTFIKAVASATSITLSANATGSHTGLTYSITPDRTDTLYTGVITLTQTQNLTAVSYKSGYFSPVAQYVFTLSSTQVPSPSFSPVAGTYGGGTLTVTISDSLVGSVIFYTTDGTTPAHDGSYNPTGTSVKINSNSGTATLPLGTTSIKALGGQAGLTDSAVATVTYTVTTGSGGAVATPTFTPDGFTSPGHVGILITIATSTTGAHIRYTKDGSTPTELHGALISAASGTASVLANRDTFLQAIAFKSGMTNSAVKEAEYDFVP